MAGFLVQTDFVQISPECIYIYEYLLPKKCRMLYHANRINVAMMQMNTCRSMYVYSWVMNKLIKHTLVSLLIMTCDQGIPYFANVKFKFQYKSVKDSINLGSQ